MDAIKRFFVSLFEAVSGFVMIGLYVIIAIGDLYWLWMSIQIGSFWMFVLGIGGPTVFVAAPIGAYSLIFGIPDWIFFLFG